MNSAHPITFSIFLKLLRCHQYIKNTFIILPVFFAGKITEIELLGKTVVAFIAFSLVASAVYIFNDIRDIEVDRKHPQKKYRPLALGAVSLSLAICLMIFLTIAGTVLMGYLSAEALVLLGSYIVINLAYSVWLKHIALIDITLVAIGFVLRLYIGSAVAEVFLSMWMVIMTFLLALFLALAKRRDDVLLYLNNGQKMRQVIDGYNLEFLNASMMSMAAVIIVAYIMYCVSPEVMQKMHSEQLYLTTVFVVLGIMRYMQLAFVEQNSGNPTAHLFRDRFLQITIIGWMGAFLMILYL